MTREIKFRAWNKRLKKLMFIQEINFVESLTLQAESEPNINNIMEVCNFVGCNLMQFTGLLDKNGKEIWESDLLKDDDQTVEVTWCDGQFFGVKKSGQGGGIDRTYFKSCEVIGNIYEHAHQD